MASLRADARRDSIALRVSSRLKGHGFCSALTAPRARRSPRSPDVLGVRHHPQCRRRPAGARTARCPAARVLSPPTVARRTSHPPPLRPLRAPPSPQTFQCGYCGAITEGPKPERQKKARAPPCKLGHPSPCPLRSSPRRKNSRPRRPSPAPQGRCARLGARLGLSSAAVMRRSRVPLISFVVILVSSIIGAFAASFNHLSPPLTAASRPDPPAARRP